MEDMRSEVILLRGMNMVTKGIKSLLDKESAN